MSQGLGKLRTEFLGPMPVRRYRQREMGITEEHMSASRLPMVCMICTA